MLIGAGMTAAPAEVARHSVNAEANIVVFIVNFLSGWSPREAAAGVSALSQSELPSQ
jgi:hypothetical protein